MPKGRENEFTGGIRFLMQDEPRTRGPGWLRRARSLLINIAFAIGVVVIVSAFQSRNMLDTDRQAAPGLSGPTLDGELYDLGTIGERPVLVYFFAPWCRICAFSSDNLVRLRRWRDESALEIVAVALDWTDTEEVRAYARRHGLNVPVVLGSRDVSNAWQVYAFPSYYVLDREQRIAKRDIGYSSQLGLWWRSLTIN